jgi:transaldolase
MSLKTLTQQGQMVWLDQLTHDLLSSQTMADYLSAGVTGITSNPAIFSAAFATGVHYQNLRSTLTETQPEARYEALVRADIIQACQRLRPSFDQTNGQTGYVSWEVFSHLAHDTTASVREAKRLFASVNEPNLMIKLPATPAGIEAIPALIAAGIPLNMTLIFSLTQIHAIAQAYELGLDILAQDNPNQVKHARLVASLFLSRLDAVVDPHLATENQGLTAIALAHLAYKMITDQAQKGRMQALIATYQARPLSLLWASTATKNPSYPALHYVNTLAAPDTVTTLPTKVLEAAMDHAQAAVFPSMQNAQAHLTHVEALGIHLERIAQDLLRDGLKAFDVACDDLLAFAIQP